MRDDKNSKDHLTGALALLCLALFLSGPGASGLSAQPSIGTINVSPDPVGRYERLELTVGVTAGYTNPFNPEEIDLWAVFTSPGLDEWRVNGFWDGTDWKVRFAAADTGSWGYRVHVQDSPGQDSSSVGTFSCESSPVDSFSVFLLPSSFRSYRFSTSNSLWRLIMTCS